MIPNNACTLRITAARITSYNVCYTKLLRVPVLNSIIYSRNVYDDSEERGLSVVEIEPDGKAAAEIKAIAKEFMDL